MELGIVKNYFSLYSYTMYFIVLFFLFLISMFFLVILRGIGVDRNLVTIQTYIYFISIYLIFFLFILISHVSYTLSDINLMLSNDYVGNLFTYDKVILLFLILITILFIFLIYLFEFIDTKYIRLTYLFISLVFFATLVHILTSKTFLQLYVYLEMYSLVSIVLLTVNKDILKTDKLLKYFGINILASIFYLLGTTILYYFTGSLNFEFATVVISPKLFGIDSTIINIGAVLIITSILLKLGIAPLHFWVLDVYNLAPYPILAQLIILPKVALYGILYKLTYNVFYTAAPILTQYYFIVALLTMFFGILYSIDQKKIKDFIIASSLLNNGLLLLTFSFKNVFSLLSLILYLKIYLISLSLFFFLLIYMRFYLNKNYIYLSELIESTNDLHRPTGLYLLLLLLSFLGVPPFAGFWGKYQLLLSGMASSNPIIILTMLLFLTISSFYYLRIIIYLFSNGHLNYKILITDSFVGHKKSFFLLCRLYYIIFVAIGLYFLIAYGLFFNFFSYYILWCITFQVC